MIYNSNYFFLELGDFGSGSITAIEAQTNYFVLTIKNPEVVTIF